MKNRIDWGTIALFQNCETIIAVWFFENESQRIEYIKNANYEVVHNKENNTKQVNIYYGVSPVELSELMV